MDLMKVGNASADNSGNSSSSPSAGGVATSETPQPEPSASGASSQAESSGRRRRRSNSGASASTSDVVDSLYADYVRDSKTASASHDAVVTDEGAPQHIGAVGDRAAEAEAAAAAASSGTTSAPAETPVSYDYKASKRRCDEINADPLRKPQLLHGENELLLLQRSHHFENLPVNQSNSSVHVPVNIYDRCMLHFSSLHFIQLCNQLCNLRALAAVEIIEEAQWSRQLDAVFSENLKRDKKLKWQYFASQSGLFRVFPGTRVLYR